MPGRGIHSVRFVKRSSPGAVIFLPRSPFSSDLTSDLPVHSVFPTIRPCISSACQRALCLLLGVLLAGGLPLGCTSERSRGSPQPSDTSSNALSATRKQDTLRDVSIQEALAKHTDSLMAISGVNGVGQGRCDGKPCIKVFVIEKTSAVKNEVPAELEGYPVKIEETGRFEVQPQLREDSSEAPQRP